MAGHVQRSGPYEHRLQQQLQGLLQKLGWSYAALWSLNPRSRTFVWKGGYYRVVNPNGKAGQEEWNAQRFSSTYKSCSFAPGQGCVGLAHTEGRYLWLSGKPSFQYTALMQSQFLMAASIQTVLCIPCLDSVLELGTTRFETENSTLVEQIQDFLSNEVMAPHLEFLSNASIKETTSAATQSEMPITHFSSTAALTQPSIYQPAVGNSVLCDFQSPSHKGPITSEDLNQPELNTPLAVPEQTQRSASMSNLRNGMFIQQSEQAHQEKDISKGAVADSDVLATEWRLARSDLHTQSLLMNSQYRSMSDTPSTSLSGNEDVSQVSTSPDHPMSQVATSQHGDRASQSNSSSSARRSWSSQEPQKSDLSLSNGTSLQHLCSPEGGPDCNIQQALSLMLSGGQNPYTDEDWRQFDFTTNNTTETLGRVAVPVGTDQDVALQTFKFSNIRTREEQINTSPQGQFKRWKNNRIVAMMPNIHNDHSPNQFVLRRCLQMLKNLPEAPEVATQLKDAGRIQTQESIQTSLPDQRFEPESNLRINDHRLEEQQVQTQLLHALKGGGVAPRPVRNTSATTISTAGGAQAGHDEAAVNHMLAERRRRVKQKENFTVLRKLVPIISKADKASILGDAILYLKDLQAKIQELEQSNQESKQRYKELELRYKEIEQQNKEL